MRKLMAGLGVALGAWLVVAGPAMAATSGDQTFTIVGEDNTGTVVASGPITGVGTDVETSDTTDTFVFDAGSITISHIDNPGGTQSFNPTTCIGRGTFTGNYTITSGTGAYANATGSGTYSGRFFFVGDRDETGQCAEEGGFSFFTVRVSGTTTLP